MQSCGTFHLKKKRKANGNLTRRPPARLIALYKVFKVSVKPFQRLAECEAEPHEESLGGVRGGSPGEKASRKRLGRVRGGSHGEKKGKSTKNVLTRVQVCGTISTVRKD